MKILLIQSEVDYYNEFKTHLQRIGIYFLEVQNSPNSEELVTNILQAVNNDIFDAIFSLIYQPRLSLAAGALNIKYVAWASEGYNSSLYDASILNPWNIIFVTNSTLCVRLKNIGVANCFYMPLGASDKLQSEVSIITSDINKKELMLWSSAIYDDLSVIDAIPKTKDFTKGYVDGVAEVHKNYYSKESLYNSLPKTVREDIENSYPADKSYYETNVDYYDHNLFGPILDRTNAYPYFGKMDIRDIIKKITVVSDINFIFDDVFHESVQITKSKDEIYNQAANYINIYIPTFDNRNIMTFDVWNMMGLGIPVFVPENMICGLPKELVIDTFKKPYDVELLIREYINNPHKLIDKTQSLKKYIRNECSLSHRVAEIVGIIDYLK